MTVSIDAETRAALLAIDGVSRETIDRLTIFVELLETWQRKVNLVSPATLPDVWRRHVLDSAQLRDLIPNDAQTLVDLGSGAGFPGLVLAVLGPWKTHLVEADQRKAVFLREAARLTDSRVEVHARRIETPMSIVGDIVTARALAPLPKLLEYSGPLLSRRGRALFPKGRTVRSELTDVPEQWKRRVRLVGSATDHEGAIVVVEGKPDD
jgi:16S rRNA (guanine527-N7)-methyltransferase